MAYARIENDVVVEYPLYEGEIRLRYPSVSFPKPFDPPAGYVAIQETTMPAVDYTENVALGTPTLVDGAWIQQWDVTAASAEEIAERTESQAAAVRNDRNKRLADCDWTQLADAPVDHTEWATYRQALRDATAQEGFPWEVEWPQQP